MDPRLAGSGSSRILRPDCVPTLDLGILADRDNKLKNPVSDYEPKLKSPDTASTVSWGYHDYSPASKSRESKRPPFALHHAPQATPHISERNPRPTSVPRLNLSGQPESAPAVHPTSQRNPLIPPFHTHEDQAPIRSGRGDGQRSPSGMDLEKRTEAQKLAETRKREHIMETVLTDQLSRAAISDPQQDEADMPASNRLHFGEGQKPKIRNLHYTKVRTTTTGTEQLLSNCMNFTARIITRNGQFALRLLYGFYFPVDNSITVYEYRQFGKQSSALPFVNRGSYSHVVGRKKGRKFAIQDISVGYDLSFDTSLQGSLPATLAKQDVLMLRIVDVDAAKEKRVFEGRVPYDPEIYAREMYPALTNQEHQDNRLLSELQKNMQQRIRRRASKTLTGLAIYFDKLDQTGVGKFTKDEILPAFNTFHVTVDSKLFSSVWLILDQHSDGMLTYSDIRRYFFGEMNEFRNNLVRKAFQKIDANKSGTITMNETRKFFCPRSHPLVIAGKLTEAEVKEDFYDLFNNRKHEVSYGVFEDYHEGVSLNTATDDEFTEVMKACWNL